MASKRAERMLDNQNREQQNARLDKMERMITKLYDAQFGKGGKSAPVDATGDVEPFEVPADELAETPVLVPVTAADEGKSGKSKK